MNRHHAETISLKVTRDDAPPSNPEPTGGNWVGNAVQGVRSLAAVRWLAVFAALLPMRSLGAEPNAEAAMAAQPEWWWAESSYLAQGRYSDALRVIENVQQHLRTAGKTHSPDFVAVTIQRGVILCRGLGNYAAAASAYQEADDVCIRLHGATSTERLEILNRRCELLAKQKRFSEAAEVGRTAVRLVTTLRGATHPETADALHYLALALADLPDTGETEPILEHVLKIRRATEGENGYWTGLEWNNLGIYHLQSGRLEEARKGILTGEKILLRHVSAQTPDAIAVQRNLIRLALEGDEQLDAVRRAERLFAIELGLFRQAFPSLDESGRLDMKAQFEPGRWFSTLGATQPIARALLQTKAMTIDEMLAAPATPALARDPYAHLLRPENAARGLRLLSPTLAAQRRQMAEVPGSKPPAASPATSRRTGPTALYSVTPQQVCAALPADTIAIEFTRYKHYVGRFRDEDRYGALVFLPSGPAGGHAAQKLHWVPLGSAAAIDREITALLDDATDSLAALKFAARLKALHELIWAPVAKLVPAGTENVFVSPDGQLCFLPFSCLLDPQGVFLADRHLVMYLSTVRDLFRTDTVDRIRTDQFSIFAAPTFGHSIATATDPSALRYRDADARSLERLQLVDLPGTRREAGILANLAKERRLRPVLFTGDDATKANVYRLAQPRIVHFATHGFMLAPAMADVASNPMDRSGLALAGAQTALAALAQGRALPALEHDGLLTARQVAKLPWRATWLVTLSACNTGRGEARDGESVLGLRRGFLAAGVENLLLSLWKISDDDTVDFMRDFYTRALDSADAATALALTQRAWLTRRRQERGIAAAVTTAGAFVLSTSGRLALPPSSPEPK